MATARDLIELCQLWLRDPHQDWHDDEKMLLYLNRGLKDIAEWSQSITTYTFRPVTEGIFRYALPEDFLYALIVGYQSDDYGYRRLKLRKDATIDHISLNDDFLANVYGDYPTHYSVSGRSTIDMFVGYVHAIADNGLTFSMRFTEEASGADTFQFETTYFERGDRLLNMTDGSEATIIDIDTTLYQLDRSPLKGGEDNELAVGDNIRISKPNASHHTLNLAPVPQETSDVGDEPLSIFYARSHRKMTQTDIDNTNDELELDLEFQSALENRVCYYGSLAQHGIEHPQTRLFLANGNEEYRRALPKVKKRVRDEVTLWRQSVGNRVRNIRITGATTSTREPLTERRLP